MKPILLLGVLCFSSCSFLKEGFIDKIYPCGVVEGGYIIGKDYHAAYTTYSKIGKTTHVTRHPEKFEFKLYFVDDITHKPMFGWIKVKKSEYKSLQIFDKYNPEWRPSNYRVEYSKANEKRKARDRGWCDVPRSQAKNLKVGTFFHATW